MIIVKILGGLGNQLFQVAYAIELSRIYNEDIYLDTSVYESYNVRSFSLKNFKVYNICEKNNSNNILLRFWYSSSQITYRSIQKIIKSIGFTDNYGRIPLLCLSKVGLIYNFDQYYYNTLTSWKGNKCIYGYFQSEKYFVNSKELIKQLFVPNEVPGEREKMMTSLMTVNESVAVSMRLGEDYLNCSELNICDEDYYFKAIEKIKTILLSEKLSLFIFSDDIELAKKLFYKLNVDEITFITDFKDYEALRLMTKCKHFIIPNSSFSWWGAYLADNPEKIIISPDKWFNNLKGESDIYTDKMIKISEIK